MAQTKPAWWKYIYKRGRQKEKKILKKGKEYLNLKKEYKIYVYCICSAFLQ